MNPRPTLLPAAAALALAALPAAHAAPITTATLLRDMTDLAGMASFPDPLYTCSQFSSYDRNAKSPAENWFANGDRGQHLRVEERDGRKESVMMDAQGPGAIVRIWSANPAGTLRIYLDGQPEPALAAPMEDLLGGRVPGLPSPLAGERSRGWNLHFPIPYARHCKVTTDSGDIYYHVNYRTYPQGTEVETFRRALLEELAGPVRDTAAALADPRAGGRPPGGTAEAVEETLAPGATGAREFAGPAALSVPALRVEADDVEAALRGVVIEAAFDGEPCVAVPLGDFFGSAPGINPFAALPLGMAANGELYSNWLMPFAKSATIRLTNTGRQPVRIAGSLALHPHRWTDRSLHFHAGWRSACDVPTRPMIDWNYLTARGRGVFAGASFAIDNPVRDWWGEGDEKIYVDGETFPSHFGTGTEDYYGYAWCNPALFTHAYHSQSRCDGPGNYGRTSVNRFHILDRIPFTRDLRFDMELWHWHERCKVNMAVTAYWYARPGASDQFPPVTPEAAVVRPLEAWQPPRVAGALEGEELKILAVTGTAAPQDWPGLSGERHLWWHVGVQPGGSLTVLFPAPNPGRYRVFARCMKAKDYGIHQLAVNGRAAGAPIDFFHAPDPAPSDEIDLGVHTLEAANNRLTVTATGANPQAEPAHMFGLDYLRLVPAE